MILRRITANFRRQDWTAVAIELVVVILGVFIGVQASNWNADREQDQKSAVFTERLKADLRIEAGEYEMQIDYYGQVHDNARRAADALSGHASLPDEALLIAAFRATQFRVNVRQRATYDELTSTGELGLIRDLALRKLAMGVYSTHEFDWFTDEGRASPYRQAFRRRVPFRVQDGLEAACGDRRVPVGKSGVSATQLDYPCSINLPPAEIATAAAVLRSDPEFLPLLNQRIADVGSSINNVTAFDYDALRDSLRAIVRERP